MTWVRSREHGTPPVVTSASIEEVKLETSFRKLVVLSTEKGVQKHSERQQLQYGAPHCRGSGGTNSSVRQGHRVWGSDWTAGHSGGRADVVTTPLSCCQQLATRAFTGRK